MEKTGRVIQKDGKLWLVVCPRCKEKNHLDMYDRGECIHCGYVAQESDVMHEVAGASMGKRLLLD